MPKADHWNHLRTLIEINASFLEGVTEHYKAIGLQYVDVPEVVGITGGRTCLALQPFGEFGELR